MLIQFDVLSSSRMMADDTTQC